MSLQAQHTWKQVAREQLRERRPALYLPMGGIFVLLCAGKRSQNVDEPGRLGKWMIKTAQKWVINTAQKWVIKTAQHRGG